ncbi:hypothetical protein RRG08_056559 [Elysia crispata]|uniref:Uncharacterized protein n=1 Tax=Elysia crispata TaxID=231223 RepID=A0AAE0YDK9_9GAST|nr:hypothetical protein RRG08_056559 [Elysia crispata]
MIGELINRWIDKGSLVSETVRYLKCGLFKEFELPPLHGPLIACSERSMLGVNLLHSLWKPKPLGRRAARFIVLTSALRADPQTIPHK